MESRRFYRFGLCLLVLALQGVTEISAASLTCTYNPAPSVILGTTNSSLRCSYSVDSGERLNLMYWKVRRSPDSSFSNLFTILGFPTDPYLTYEVNTIATEYKNRVSVSVTPTDTSMTIPEIKCQDEVTYQVEMQYSQDSTVKRLYANVSVTVKVAAQYPQVLTKSPTGKVPETTLMSFTCRANVGRPDGSFRWLLYEKGQLTSTPRDVTSLSSITSQAPDSSVPCTQVVTSLLQINVTRREHEAVVRCAVEHSLLGSPVYNQTARLDVQYGIRDSDVAVGANPAKATFVVGEQVTLTCTGISNPPPLFTWSRADSNWTMVGSLVSLTDLQINDSGRYICVASNNVSGTSYEGSTVYELRVVKVPPTTTPSTPRPGEETTPSGAGSTAPSNQNPTADNTGLIIGLVVGGVVLIVLIVIIVFVVMRRRKRKEVEEPPEKPWNNHQNIHSLSGQPDLVTDDKKYNSYGKPQDDLSPYSIDDRPRSRKPVDFGSSSYDAPTYMPQV